MKENVLISTWQHENFQQNVGITVTDPETGETTVIRRHLNDIALIQLNESLSFSDSVRSACLPDTSEQQQQHDDTSCWVAGWGENQGKFIPSSLVL